MYIIYNIIIIYNNNIYIIYIALTFSKINSNINRNGYIFKILIYRI